MSSTLPNSITCCTPCPDPSTPQIPGPAGTDGEDGAAGADGVNAFTTVDVQFVMPAELASIAITVGNSTWLAVNQIVYIARTDGSVRGWFQVTAISSPVVITVKNLEDTATSAYTDNSAPGSTFTVGSKVCAAGMQGPAGILAGAAAGGDLAGTYPNPTLRIPEFLGDVLVGDGTGPQALSKGTNGQIFVADTAQALDVGWKSIIPITGDTDVLVDRIVRLSATTGLPIPLESSRMAVRDAGGAGTVVADDRSSVANARGADAVDLQTSRNATTQVASGNESVICGGRRNSAQGTQSAIVGGDTNEIVIGAEEAFIGGGGSNSIAATGERAVIAGGDDNTVSGDEAAIVGGQSNEVTSSQGFIGGGDNNTVSGIEAAIAGGNTNIASGAASFVGAGITNNASGGASVIPGGQNNVASNTYAVAGGLDASAIHYGERAWASGMLATRGDAQEMRFVLRNSTTDATPTELFVNGSTIRMTIPTNTTWVFTVYTVARDSLGALAESAAWEVRGAISNDNGATTLVAAVTAVTLADDTGGTWVHAVTADNTNDALIITVTGEAGRNVRWVSTVKIVQITY